jgi:progressive ankylosis protein
VSLAGFAFTQRNIFLFWLPLAASWALMSAEGPVLQAVIARLPDMQTQLAAFGIVMSLEITIESPVIMLLATSTALATSARNYLALRRFAFWINLGVTAVAILVAFTPLYGLILRGVIGLPPRVAEAAQPGMKIMTLWSAAIGYRRFLQGVLIRHGQTRRIGYGTATRLAASAGCGILLALFTGWSGVVIASTALMAGVLVEAAFILSVAQPAVRRLLAQPNAPSTGAISVGDVARYHAPLAATSLLTLLAQPLVGAGLARMPFPEENLAAWPVIWGLLFIFRSPAFALPEVVIALSGERGGVQPVRRFCRNTGVACWAAMALLVATPLLRLYLRHVAGLPQALMPFVVPGTLLAQAIPFVNAFHSWFRGLLMSAGRTSAIYRGMGLNLAATGLWIWVAVLLGAPGAASAVVGLTMALLGEVWYLRSKASRMTNYELRNTN